MSPLKIKAGPEDGHFIISGNIDEFLDFSPLKESTEKSLVLDLKKIVKINSMGVKKWINGIQELLAMGKKLEYRDCSEIFVETCNFTTSFTKGVVVSFFEVTFTCDDCDVLEVKMLNATDVVDGETPVFRCPECKEKMTLEEAGSLSFLEE